MKDRGFLVIAGLIGLAVATDIYANDAFVTLFLVHKVIQLVEFIQFWR